MRNSLEAVLAQSGAWSEVAGRVQAMGRGLLASVPNLVAALLVLAGFYLGGKAVRALVSRVTRGRRKHQNIALVLGRLAQGGIVTLGVLVAAVIVFPNFTPASLIQLLGVSSVAIGFAFRDILQNYLAGILILVTEPFRIGDQIIFGSFEGTVEDVHTRATLLRTYDGRRVVVPNGELFTNSVTVNTAFEKRRLEYDVGIGYGDDIDRARELILLALQEIDLILTDPPPEVLAYELAASSVTLRVRWWIDPPRKRDALQSRDRVITAVKRTLVENGIDLPFPTQHVLFHDQTEATDGDRKRQREGWPAGKGDVPRPRKIAASLLRLRPGKKNGDGAEFDSKEER